MGKTISFIYANRNRDSQRIKNSWDSLQAQNDKNFEVVFVDFGSDKKLAAELKALSKNYQFVKFFHLPVYGLLWNKSKALNYGISKAKGDYVFIADVDLLFQKNTTTYLQEVVDSKSFRLFSLGYLEKKHSFPADFNSLKPHRFGNVNGMILVSREALIAVDGLDEFFHFYGSEDEDLFLRLENLGLKRENSGKRYFYHQWHRSFSASKEKNLTQNPRLSNAMRINQRHYNFHKEQKIIRPKNQDTISTALDKLDQDILKNPDNSFKIPNIAAYVEHFLEYEIFQFSGKTIAVTFYEDPFYHSSKYKAKILLGKQTQPYLSLKEVNDLVLKKIIFDFRDHNYSFKISADLNQIEFSIKL